MRSYRRAAGSASSAQHATVLLPPSREGPRGRALGARRRRRRLRRAARRAIASGLRGLPGFVLVSSGDEPTRVVLRGAARAAFTLADGETVEVDGGGRATWVEQILHGVTAARGPPRGRGRRRRPRPRDRPGAGLARRPAAVRRARWPARPRRSDVESGCLSEPRRGAARLPSRRSATADDRPADVGLRRRPPGGGAARRDHRRGVRARVAGARSRPVDEVDEVDEPGDALATSRSRRTPRARAAEEPADREPAGGRADRAVRPDAARRGRLRPRAGRAVRGVRRGPGDRGACRRGARAEEPAADELEDEPHWPFSDPDDTGEQPRRREPDAPQPGAGRHHRGARGPRGARPRATSTPRRRHPATRSPAGRRLPPPHRRHRGAAVRRPRRPHGRRWLGPEPVRPAAARHPRPAARRRASPPQPVARWCSPAARPSTSTGPS